MAIAWMPAGCPDSLIAYFYYTPFVSEKKALFVNFLQSFQDTLS